MDFEMPCGCGNAQQIGCSHCESHCCRQMHTIHQEQMVWAARLEKEAEPVVIQVEKITEEAKIPLKMTPDAKGFDVEASFQLEAGEIRQIHLGLKIKMPQGTYAEWFARSSNFLKGLYVYKGLVDCDYGGELFVVIKNEGEMGVMVDGRIAQLVFGPDKYHKLEVVDKIDYSEPRFKNRGKASGSTGKAVVKVAESFKRRKIETEEENEGNCKE